MRLSVVCKEAIWSLQSVAVQIKSARASLSLFTFRKQQFFVRFFAHFGTKLGYFNVDNFTFFDNIYIYRYLTHRLQKQIFAPICLQTIPFLLLDQVASL